MSCLYWRMHDLGSCSAADARAAHHLADAFPPQFVPHLRWQMTAGHRGKGKQLQGPGNASICLHNSLHQAGIAKANGTVCYSSDAVAMPRQADWR